MPSWNTTSQLRPWLPALSVANLFAVPVPLVCPICALSVASVYRYVSVQTFIRSAHKLTTDPDSKGTAGCGSLSGEDHALLCICSELWLFPLTLHLAKISSGNYFYESEIDSILSPTRAWNKTVSQVVCSRWVTGGDSRIT